MKQFLASHLMTRKFIFFNFLVLIQSVHSEENLYDRVVKEVELNYSEINYVALKEKIDKKIRKNKPFHTIEHDTCEFLHFYTIPMNEKKFEQHYKITYQNLIKEYLTKITLEEDIYHDLGCIKKKYGKRAWCQDFINLYCYKLVEIYSIKHTNKGPSHLESYWNETYKESYRQFLEGLKISWTGDLLNDLCLIKKAFGQERNFSIKQYLDCVYTFLSNSVISAYHTHKKPSSIDYRNRLVKIVKEEKAWEKKNQSLNKIQEDFLCVIDKGFKTKQYKTCRYKYGIDPEEQKTFQEKHGIDFIGTLEKFKHLLGGYEFLANDLVVINNKFCKESYCVPFLKLYIDIITMSHFNDELLVLFENIHKQEKTWGKKYGVEYQEFLYKLKIDWTGDLITDIVQMSETLKSKEYKPETIYDFLYIFLRASDIEKHSKKKYIRYTNKFVSKLDLFDKPRFSTALDISNNIHKSLISNQALNDIHINIVPVIKQLINGWRENAQRQSITNDFNKLSLECPPEVTFKQALKDLFEERYHISYDDTKERLTHFNISFDTHYETSVSKILYDPKYAQDFIVLHTILK